MEAAEDPILQTEADPQFVDLMTGPGCRIPKTELRAISLDQLGRIMEHATRRLTDDGEVWQLDQYDANGVWSQVVKTDPQDINLYDANAMIIKPATQLKGVSLVCSLVELMADGPQSGDYFTSHWQVSYTAQFAVAHCAWLGGASPYI